MAMEDRMTDNVKRVLTLAQSAAAEFGKNNIGTEHLLLAMAEAEGSTAAGVLREFGMDSALLRELLRVLQSLLLQRQPVQPQHRSLPIPSFRRTSS